MKFSMRVKVVSVLAVFVVMLAGSAWADYSLSDDANTLISAYNAENSGKGALSASVNGNEVTISGTIQNATTPLYLEDITENHYGVTIIWNATLTADIDNFDFTNSNLFEPYLIGLEEESPCAFKIIGGKISLYGKNDPQKSWPRTIFAKGGVEVIVEGGTVENLLPIGSVIDVDRLNNDEIAKVTVKGGTINSPHSAAISVGKRTGLDLKNTSDITGIVEITYGENGRYEGKVYGDVEVIYDDGGFNLEGGKLTILKGSVLTLETGIEFIANGELAIDGDGVLKKDISGVASRTTGDLKNGILNNNGRISVPKNGKIINNGILNNKKSGVIVNEGKIDSANGTINNEGTIKSKPADTFDNFLSNISSGGSGCNAAGFAPLALIAIPLLLRKKHS
jgi:Synergist-CTERM protein sorting domain-containing protein